MKLTDNRKGFSFIREKETVWRKLKSARGDWWGCQRLWWMITVRNWSGVWSLTRVMIREITQPLYTFCLRRRGWHTIQASYWWCAQGTRHFYGRWWSCWYERERERGQERERHVSSVKHRYNSAFILLIIYLLHWLSYGTHVHYVKKDVVLHQYHNFVEKLVHSTRIQK